jgi:activating signal cointegrator 1
VKALSLWQPWASLVAIKTKRNETRSWLCHRAMIGQRIAVHAAKTEKGLAAMSDALRALCGDVFPWDLVHLPFGAIVCTAVIRESIPVADIGALYREEIESGDYSAGRYAWPLWDVRQLSAPIPCKGAQGFWSVPDDVLAQLARQGAA